MYFKIVSITVSSCQFLIKYNFTSIYLPIYPSKQKSSLNTSYANVLNHNQCSMPSFAKFQSYWCYVDLLYKYTISKRLSPQTEGRGI